MMAAILAPDPGATEQEHEPLSNAVLGELHAIHTVAKARQAARSARQTNSLSHFPVHPRNCAEWLRTAGIFLSILTSLAGLCGMSS
ncbi:hypothetical protein WJX77_005955 [Trebouxia sp. C0004]